MDAFSFLETKVSRQIPDEGAKWLKEKIESLSGDFEEKEFYLTFSMAPRYVGKEPLQINKEDLIEAGKIRKGFQPINWTVDQAVRTLFLLTISKQKENKFFHCLVQVHEHADVRESVAIYASLPLLPYPEKHHHLTTEGIRTNMKLVFDAIALDNPYPADYLDDQAWNQMVLKSIFMQRPLYRIYGIDDRANENLARMLIDFAHERWAAGRNVIPELWRPVTPFINENTIKDIQKLFENGEQIEKEAGGLACFYSNPPQAKNLLEQYPEIKSKIEKGALTWDIIGQKYYQEDLNKA